MTSLEELLSELIAELDDSSAEDGALDDFAPLLAGFSFSEDEELKLSTDELTGLSPFGSAELPLSPHPTNASANRFSTTKNFFITPLEIQIQKTI